MITFLVKILAMKRPDFWHWKHSGIIVGFYAIGGTKCFDAFGTMKNSMEATISFPLSITFFLVLNRYLIILLKAIVTGIAFPPNLFLK